MMASNEAGQELQELVNTVCGVVKGIWHVQRLISIRPQVGSGMVHDSRMTRNTNEHAVGKLAKDNH